MSSGETSSQTGFLIIPNLKKILVIRLFYLVSPPTLFLEELILKIFFQ